MRAADLHRLARALRAIALAATENTGDDRVNPGELAVLEDIARNPGTTIGAVSGRTGLSQSLVSRITHVMADAGVLALAPDPHDRRKVQLDLDPATRRQIKKRADNDIADALARHVPGLTPAELSRLERHLHEASRLLSDRPEGSPRQR